MKIGLFTDFYAPHTGGVESAVAAHAAALRARGHTVTIVCPGNLKQKQAASGEVRLESHHYKPVAKHHPLVLPTKANQRIVDKLDFDVVHVHTEHAAAFLGVWYARRHRVPVFETKHTDNVAWVQLNRPAALLRVDAFTLDRWTTRWSRHLGLTARPKLRFTDEPAFARHSWRHMLLLTPYMTATLGPSKYLLDQARKHYPAGHYIVLQNGIDTGRFTPEYEAADQPVRILWVARTSAEKRPLQFLQAISLLASKTEVPFVVDLIGAGNQDAQIRQYVAKHNLANVRLHGSLLRDEVLPFFNHADIFAFTSYHFDTQGLVVAEALSAGAAVMLCDERVMPPDAGRIADGLRLSASPSAHDMAATLGTMLRKKTAAAAPLRGFAAATYSLDVLGERLEEIYRTPKSLRTRRS